MHTKQELDRRLHIAGISPLKKLGQNFLLNPKITRRLVEVVAQSNPALVVEIGPGLGALTDELIDKPWRLTVVEVDAGLIKYWNQRDNNEKILIVHGDALRANWSEIVDCHPAILVSNLPYSIAASLVVELSTKPTVIFDEMILMFQKEVAERIEAPFHNKDYGMLSVVAQTFWTISKVIDAGPQDFFPVPNVGSRVLQFKFKAPSVDSKKFLNLVKLAFSQRRKKLSSNLKGGFPKEKIQAVFKELGLSDDSRAQELTPPAFIDLYSHLHSK